MFHNLFPTLIAEFDLSDRVDNDVIVDKMRISGLAMHGLLNKGQSSYLGGFDCALTRLAMTDLQQAIKDSVDEYCKHAGLEENVIVNSWCNIVNEGGQVRRHRHEKSVLSGVYYPKSSSDDCPLMFENPNQIYKMTETKTYDTPTNWHEVGFTVEAGRLLLWPSYLHHYSKKNGSEERFSISFNTLEKSFIDSINRLT